LSPCETHRLHAMGFANGPARGRIRCLYPSYGFHTRLASPSNSMLQNVPP
jgi:hypothetical protein